MGATGCPVAPHSRYMVVFDLSAPRRHPSPRRPGITIASVRRFVLGPPFELGIGTNLYGDLGEVGRVLVCMMPTEDPLRASGRRRADLLWASCKQVRGRPLARSGSFR